MKRFLYIIPLLVFCFVTPLIAQEQTSTKKKADTIEVEGIGTSETLAIENAKRNAVDQVCGMVIASWTEVRNFQTVKDLIFSKSTGFVKSWKLVSSKKEVDDSYTVKIKAVVTEVLDEVLRNEAALDLLLQWVNRPRIVIAITENIGEKKGSIVAETEIGRIMQSKGFTIVSGDQIAAVKNRDEVLAGLVAGDKAAAAVGAEFDAEILITGSAEAKSISSEMLGNMKSGQANISARILLADDGRILAQETFHGAKVHLDPSTACVLALKDASAKMAQYLFRETIRTWSTEQSNARSVKLRVMGVSFSGVRAFESYLKTSISGTKEINRLSFSAGVALFSLRFEGSAEDLGTLIDGKSFGDSKIQVVGQTKNALKIQISK